MKTFLQLAVLSALVAAAQPAFAAGSCCAPALPSVAPLPAASLYQAEVSFTTEAGRPFRLAELRGRPVALTMFFASCTYACPVTVSDLARIRERLPAAVREQALMVMVSFDVVRDTPEALRAFRSARELDANWILLRGDDDAVRELAALLGVKFKREADGQFAHSNLITILSTGGEILHQRAGLNGGHEEAAAALAAAAKPGGA